MPMGVYNLHVENKYASALIVVFHSLSMLSGQFSLQLEHTISLFEDNNSVVEVHMGKNISWS